jgi:hypothetical protein
MTMDNFVINYNKQKYIVLDAWNDEKGQRYYLIANTSNRKMIAVSLDFIKNSEYKALCGD